MKKIIIAVVIAASTLVAAPAEAAKKPPHCKHLSTVTTIIGPGGVQYNDDGTSETLTKYRVTDRSRCRGKIVTTTYVYVGY